MPPVKGITFGQPLTIAYRLPGATITNEFRGVVVWINPLGASGGRPVGIGIKIVSEPDSHKHHIENYCPANWPPAIQPALCSLVRILALV